MHKARRPQAVAIALSQDLARTMRLRLLLVSSGATVALLTVLAYL